MEERIRIGLDETYPSFGRNTIQRGCDWKKEDEEGLISESEDDSEEEEDDEVLEENAYEDEFIEDVLDIETR